MVQMAVYQYNKMRTAHFPSSVTRRLWVPPVSLRLGHDTALDARRKRLHPFTTVSPLRYPKGRINGETALFLYRTMLFALLQRKWGISRKPSLGGRGTAKRWMRGKGSVLFPTHR